MINYTFKDQSEFIPVSFGSSFDDLPGKVASDMLNPLIHHELFLNNPIMSVRNRCRDGRWLTSEKSKVCLP